MSVNITGFDEDIFFAVNTAVGVSLFATLVLPLLVLCILCLAALIIAKDINNKIKVSLVNIFIVEIGTWVGFTMYLLGFPLRFRALAGQNWICSIEISLGFAFTLQKFSANSLYAVSIYLFIKHGEKKLKWCIILPCIAVTWILAALFGTLPYFDGFGVANINGLCTVSGDSVWIKTSIPVAIVICLICMSTVVVFSILTGIYVKHNTLEDNVAIKKAVSNVLVYLAIATILSFMAFLLPAAAPPILDAVKASSGTVSVIIAEYVLLVLTLAHSIPTPVIAIVFLKAIRDALKDIGRRVVIFCNEHFPDRVENVEASAPQE